MSSPWRHKIQWFRHRLTTSLNPPAVQAAVLRRAHVRRFAELQAAADRARAAAAASEALAAETNSLAARRVADLLVRAHEAENGVSAAQAAERAAQALAASEQRLQAVADAARTQAEGKAKDLAAQVDLLADQVAELSGRQPTQLMRGVEAQLEQVNAVKHRNVLVE